MLKVVRHPCSEAFTIFFGCPFFYLWIFFTYEEEVWSLPL